MLTYNVSISNIDLLLPPRLIIAINGLSAVTLVALVVGSRGAVHGGVVNGNDLRARNLNKTRLALGLTHSSCLRGYSIRCAAATDHVNALAKRVVRCFLRRRTGIVVLLLGREWLLGHGAYILLF